MSGVLERSLAIIEHLLAHPEGTSVGLIAEKLNIPPSAAHRLLTELVMRGYAKQQKDQSDYTLTTKLVSMVLDYMGAAGIVDFAQPILDRLAQETGEFIRLAVVDGERLTWVARAQGARHGLRYDPAIDAVVQLSCTASGVAWLMTLSDEDALTMVVRQGFGRPEKFGPKAPTSPIELLKIISEARKRGYATTQDSFDAGLSSMAIPIRRGKESPVGALSIAGPTVRFPSSRFKALALPLQKAAREIAVASASSPLFASRRAALVAGE
jgi:IclR family transcriptional regulator, acetate operon repressor